MILTTQNYFQCENCQKLSGISSWPSLRGRELAEWEATQPSTSHQLDDLGCAVSLPNAARGILAFYRRLPWRSNSVNQSDVKRGKNARGRGQTAEAQVEVKILAWSLRSRPEQRGLRGQCCKAENQVEAKTFGVEASLASASLV